MDPQTTLNPAVFIGIALFGIILYVYLAVCLQAIANKTNTENAWLAWIPIANLYLMCQVARLEWWWMLLCIIPYVGIVASVYVWWKISEARGKPGWIGLLTLVPIVNFAAMGYLAFSD